MPEITIADCFDRVWSCYDAKAEDWKRFAIVDYKRPGVIRRDEFRKALKERDYLDKSHKEAPELFKKNSETLMKQAVNYADQYSTKYVALFDWDTLVLFYMESQDGNTGGECYFVTIIHNRKHMRRALLGFLERAYRANIQGEDVLDSFGALTVKD
ncbi:hypothetical protein PT974_03584 [Cladobotryum mycophilum]|uniref:Uncharacterized protein n=1 Tax=Cladobotryum mycophilum TaxID=491253 RepID=A0ABR0SSQ8_9HYPO